MTHTEQATPERDTELRFRIGVHRMYSGKHETAVVTNCGACGNRTEHYLPFDEAQEWADAHATPGNLATCPTLKGTDR